jgi:small subunit ribosomal protein S20
VANIKSAVKRIQINERNRLRNKAYKSAVKTLMKKCFVQIAKYEANRDPEVRKEVSESMNAAYSKIDKAVKRRVLHRNHGARKKSQLARAINRIEAPAAAGE